MSLFKKTIGLIFIVIFWIAIALYGALEGWWLSPVAPQENTQAFFQHTKNTINAQNNGNTALILIDNHNLAIEYYSDSAEKINKNSLFPLASTSKLFTAYGVMRLVEVGKINLDAPISTYLTRWQLPASQFNNDKVTVKQLLSHTAGLTDGLGFGDYSAEENIPSLESSLNSPRSSSGTGTITIGYEPGTQWQYSGGGYLILQLLIEEVSRQDFATWMQHNVFQPINMTRTTYEYLAKQDNISKSYNSNGQVAPSYKYAAAAATGLSSTPDDLTQFALTLLKANRSDNNTPRSTLINQMRKPLAQKFGADIWGLGTMLYAPTKSGDYIYGHDGSNDPAINTALRVNPETGDAIIVLVTGNPQLASSIGYEWVVWQTGYPDFLMFDKAIETALIPMGIGILLCIFLYVVMILIPRKVEA